MSELLSTVRGAITLDIPTLVRFRDTEDVFRRGLTILILVGLVLGAVEFAVGLLEDPLQAELWSERDVLGNAEGLLEAEVERRHSVASRTLGLFNERDIAHVAENWCTGALKFFVLARALAARAQTPDLFEDGLPPVLTSPEVLVEPDGVARADQVVADLFDAGGVFAGIADE